MATKTKPRRKKKTDEPELEQGFIPGTEPPNIPEIEQAAKVYYRAMMERTELSKSEHEAQGNLTDKMNQHGLQFYELKNGNVVTVTNKTKCKVEQPKKPKKGKTHPTDENESTNGDGEE